MLIVLLSFYLIAGGGFNVNFDPYPTTTLADEYEAGVGLDIELANVEFGIKYANSESRDGSASTFVSGGAFLSRESGYTFDQDAVVVRPDIKLASVLRNPGNEATWENLWNIIYSDLPSTSHGPLLPNVIVPADYVFLGNIARPVSPHGQYGNYIPVHNYTHELWVQPK